MTEGDIDTPLVTLIHDNDDGLPDIDQILRGGEEQPRQRGVDGKQSTQIATVDLTF